MANWANKANVGDPLSPGWQEQNLRWIEPIKGQRWQVYAPAQTAFEGLLNDLIKLGYHPTSSGGFNYRNIRGGDKLSQHAYGTAIDLNSMSNPMGQSASDIPHAAELAKKWGLEWGGNWKNRPDPMHFEYAGQNSGAGQAQGPEAPPQDPHQDFVWRMWPLAVEQSKRTGVDPRIILAQTIQETGWGKSAPNNNYFGVKGPGGSQKTLEFMGGKMQPVEANFRGYKEPSESFADYGNVLMGERYKGLREAKGLEAQAAALQASGYATDPNYGASILKIAQGIPEGGVYGGAPAVATDSPSESAGGPGTGAGTNPPVTPVATAPEKKTNWLQDTLAGLGESAGKSGMFAPGAVPAMEPIPKAALAPAGSISPLDTEAIMAKRQKLAEAMAKLNAGALWG
jgi:hypothetical protein